jgi:hypothetical protein
MGQDNKQDIFDCVIGWELIGNRQGLINLLIYFIHTALLLISKILILI